MASPAQIAANQANAVQSSGPKTAEGKSVSSRNAVRHGLTSAATLLPGEDEDHYLQLRADIFCRLAPAGTLETALAETVSTTFWKYLRMERIESAYLAERSEAMLAENPEDLATDGITAAARLFSDRVEAQRLALVLRYLNAARNAHAKAVREFEKVRKERLGEMGPERAAAAVPVAPRSVPASPPPDMTRAERRALERAWRKADKRARRNGGTSAGHAIGFVSQPDPQDACGRS